MQASGMFTRKKQTLEQKLIVLIRQQQATEWLETNQTAIASYNQQVEEQGVFADELRTF